MFSFHAFSSSYGIFVGPSRAENLPYGSEYRGKSEGRKPEARLRKLTVLLGVLKIPQRQKIVSAVDGANLDFVNQSRDLTYFDDNELKFQQHFMKHQPNFANVLEHFDRTLTHQV